MPRQLFRSLVLSILLGAGSMPVLAQNLDVTFRYIPQPGETVTTAFVRGNFNGWAANAGTQMTFVDSLQQWVFSETFAVGETREYKIFVHRNASGSSNEWLTDPLNPISNPSDNNNSVLTITDPMVFQPAEELSPSGLMGAVSAGLFSTEAFTAIAFTINGVERTDGLDFFNPQMGIFRFELDREVRDGSQFRLVATDAAGRVVEAEIGELLTPIEWETEAFRTVAEETSVKAFITRLDGTVDPDLTEATLLINGIAAPVVAVDNGVVEVTVALEMGENELHLQATIDGQDVASEPLVVTRRLHPLDRVFANVTVSGTSDIFIITLSPTDLAPSGITTTWVLDAENSTTGVTDLVTSDLEARGTVTGPGEIYFDVTMRRDDDDEDFQRVAIIIEDDGSTHQMRYEENAAWTKNAVVYEIFPLSFGPEASGTPSNPGDRLNEITASLDYIAEMGFNAIWFMPIYDDQVMTPISAGYNIVDFYTVDPKLGTNDDFKALVERAHELGIKILLDLTPSHVSPVHPWVNSLREGGPFADYIQTTPSSHNRGLDSRGANLPEIWQTEGGRDLYRKYDGFGDLANLNWDNDDLQAEMLDVIAFWVREFDIDGWRLDVYWGPWRRYGPDRFGRPLRELMKRLKPDAWLLGEIAGTGFSTEVYYADDDFGTRIVGGLDAGYDWTFYHDAIRGTYGNLSNYDAKARNGNFWPGPNARYFRFLENHDEPRIAKLFAAAPERILPLTGFLLTTTGVPMVYQGQEVNFGDVSGDERRVSVSWNTERNADFASYYQRLAHARAQILAFGTQDLATFHTTNSVYGYARPLLDENAVVLINFSSSAKTVTIDPSVHVEMSTDGPVPYYDIFADTSGAYLDAFTVTVPAYETVIYVTADDPGFDLPDLPMLPFGAVFTGVEEDAMEVPETMRLDQNYPNPFNPVTAIRFAVPEVGAVRLDVFDVLGRRVAVLVDGTLPAGTHTATFDAGSLPSGLYLYRLQAGTRTKTKTMMLVR